MATLTKIERRQLRRKTTTVHSTPRWEIRPIREYLTFATFASRLQPARKDRLIEGDRAWKL